MPTIANLSSLIEPELLQTTLIHPVVLIVDLCDPAQYATGHIPGAIHLDYADFVRGAPPVMGLLPTKTQLSKVLSRLGLRPDRPVVAYDEDGNGRAARLLWTLTALGHERTSMLNGGFHAWEMAGYPLEKPVGQPVPSTYQAQFRNLDAIADRDYILARLGQPDVVFLDARTPAEYAGKDVRSARGGHIPGAVNLDWMDTLDLQRQKRFQPHPILRSLLEARGITPDKEVIVYCQTHQRSAHAYWVLRHLGYSRVRGYPGAWSDWGNDPELPVEV